MNAPFLSFLIVFVLAGNKSWGTPASFSYQGRILKSNGAPLEYSSVSFAFSITNQSDTCTFFQEQTNGVDMRSSKGVFEVSIGTGTRVFPSDTTITIQDVFKNSVALDCVTGGNYTPSENETRLLKVQFHDGSTWNTITPYSEIRSVPFASFSYSAGRLGDHLPGAFVLKNDVATCSTGQYLTYDGAAFTCQNDSGGVGTISDLNVSAPLTKGGTASIPSIGITVGTAAGSVAAGNDTRFGDAKKIQGVAIDTTSPTANQVLKYNGTSSWVPATLAISDISGLSTQLTNKIDTTMFPTSCTAGQSLVFVTPANKFDCYSIQITESQISGTIAGTKINGNISGNAAGFTGSLTGDVSGTQTTTVVDKIKGVTVDSTAPTAGQVLTYVGTKWTPTSFSSLTPLTTKGDIFTRDASGSARLNVGTDGQFLTADSSQTEGLKWTTLQVTESQISGTISGSKISGTITHAANTGTTYTSTAGGTVTVQGPTAVISSNYILRLPTSQSTGTQALVNDGSGNLSWQSLSSGSVTSVSATSPLSSTGGTTPTLSLGGLTGLGSANQILGMNNGASGYEYKTVNGTTNQITVTHAANSMTLATPQNIHTGASPTFTGLTLSGMSSAGIVKNNASGVLSGGNSVSMTSDISGVLPLANGGTNASSFANYSVIASNSNSTALVAVPGTVNGSVLQYSATGPVFSTASYPATTTANQILYSSADNVVGGLATANSSILTTNSSGVPSFSAISGDLFSQYALLAGRSGGQTLFGGTASSENLILDSTSDSNKGNVVLAPNGGNVGVGTATPTAKLTVNGNLMLGDESTACSSSNAGAMRRNASTSVIEICRADRWTAMENSSAIPAGTTAVMTTCPAGWTQVGNFSLTATTTSYICQADSAGATVPAGTEVFMETCPSGWTSTGTASIKYSAFTAIAFSRGRVPFQKCSTAVTSAIPTGARIISQNSCASSMSQIPGFLMYFSGINVMKMDTACAGSSCIVCGTSNHVGVNSLEGGYLGDTSSGSIIYIAGGAGGRTSGAGGSTYIYGGQPTEGAGGSINIEASSGATATSTARAGGSVTLKAGASAAAGAAGSVNIYGGTGTSAVGGNVIISAGSNTGTGTGAAYVAINPGQNTTDSVYGNILLNTSPLGGGVAIGINDPLTYRLRVNGSSKIEGTLSVAGVSDFPAGIRVVGGNVSIGTASPAANFHVVGGSRFEGGTFEIIGNPSITGDVYVTGNITASGTITPSDRRLKKNITPLQNPLESILQLHGVTYDWRRDEFPERHFSENRQLGVIAQEVEAQFPEAVVTRKDGFKGVNYSLLVAPLIEAVKELYAQFNQEIANLKAENKKLKDENAEIKARLDKIERQLSSSQ